MSRFEKIKHLKSEHSHILPGGSRLDTTPAVPVERSGEANQAEQSKVRPTCFHEDSQAAQELPTAQVGPSDNSRGRAEQESNHNPSSSSSSTTQTIRQPHTIPWAVARYVSIPVINSLDHILTCQHLGNTAAEDAAEDRAEQQHRKGTPVEDQSEQQDKLPGGSRLDTTPAVPVPHTPSDHCTIDEDEESPNVPDQAEQQPTATTMQAKDDQAEHCPPQRIDAQPSVHEGRAEHCTTATLSATVDARGRAEQQSTSSSSPDNTHHTRQSHTTKWAVARYVHSPIKTCNKPILTPPYCPGTYATEDQAEQKSRQVIPCPPKMQTTEQHHILPGGSRLDTTPTVTAPPCHH